MLVYTWQQNIELLSLAKTLSDSWNRLLLSETAKLPHLQMASELFCRVVRIELLPCLNQVRDTFC